MDVEGSLPEIPGALKIESIAELSRELVPGRVLVWRHGSTFPAELWPDFIRFVEEGGSFLYLGGEPFTRPVVGKPGARVVQARTVSMLKELRLNQAYRLPAGEAQLSFGSGAGVPAPRVLGEAAWVAVLEPRLSDTKDFENEDGAPGSRDGILRPLAHLRLPGKDPRFPLAASSYAIDRLRGRYSGGRWVFHLASELPVGAELDYLLAEASRPALDFRVDPTFGCFHEGEQPSVLVRLHRPEAAAVREYELSVRVTGPMPKHGGGTGSVPAKTVEGIRLRIGKHGTTRVPLPISGKPGLYRVRVVGQDLPEATTGFWIMDRELFESGDDLDVDSYTLRRNRIPEPVIGTTTMSSTVHRKFLFEPNAAVWDDTFAELASLKMNFVRTGIWSGFRKISLDPHVVDEAWLRALEAYYLGARRHGIPILFTFFSFVPESFSGESPYFDPRSIEGQKAYISAVVSRFAKAKEMLWDLINEPSFASPDKLWLCRPNGDRYEHEAFLGWLEKRYGQSEIDGVTWEDRVRDRWRLLPGESIGVPVDADFSERHAMENHRPYRAKEYILFAQEAFADWMREMNRSIRQAGSSAMITVGQDEGGLYDRPSPLFHHDLVSYTSVHTWWKNDVLLWDGLLAKVRSKPMLVSETGMMQRELLSGEAIRSRETSAKLLSRKIGYAFGAGSFGVVQWCYEVNPYMNLDNEVGIGFKRVDGSYKPEHEVMRRFAGFFARNRQHLTGFEEPDVALIFPSSDHYTPRGLQASGTQRSVDILAKEIGVPFQVVSEHRTKELGSPGLIILPACRGISEKAWADVMKKVSAGSVLHCSGYFEVDDAGRPAVRISTKKRALSFVRSIVGDGGGESDGLRYSLGVVESWYDSDVTGLRRIQHGKGAILHYGPPLEWAESHPFLRTCYEKSLREVSIPIPKAKDVGLFVRSLRFSKACLIVAVNERSSETEFDLGEYGAKAGVLEAVPAGECRMWIVDEEGNLLDSSNS